jgi:hypothetical protein
MVGGTVDFVSEIRTDGNVAALVVPWRTARESMVTVVVKATFSFPTTGDHLELAPPDQVLRADQPRDHRPLSSIQGASEIAPYLPLCDVTFEGCAYAASGAATTAASVRLAVFRRDTALLDKTLHVFGDRVEGRVSPFVRVPLVYERAYGGVGVPENPVGVETPNVVHPADPTRPAGFAPLQRNSPTRKLLAKLDAQASDARVPLVPEGMPWEYFQAAPHDQRIEHLVGGEFVVLDGLHPRRPRVLARIPAVRGAAAFAAPDGTSITPIPLVTDMLSIDGERRICSIVWRGQKVVPSEAWLATMVLAAGLEIEGRAVDFAALCPEVLEGTQELTMVAVTASATPSQFPFALSARSQAHAVEERSAPSNAATPWGDEAIVPAPAPIDDEGTVVFEPPSRAAEPPPLLEAAPESAPVAAFEAPPLLRPVAAPAPTPPSVREAPRRAPAAGLADKLHGAGASQGEIAALLRKLEPPAPRPRTEEDDEDDET